MPKIIYANLIWFFLVMVAAVASAFARHSSDVWNTMPDVRNNYDLLFVVGFGCLFLIALIGMLKKKKLGYEIAMAFNYILALMAVLPILGLIFFNLQYGIPLSEIKLIWFANVNNIFISAVSIIFIILMSRPNVKSLFKTM